MLDKEQAIRKEIGKRLRALREEKGYTVKFVASKLGQSESTIRSWENGSRTPGDHITLKKVADFYGVTTDFLLKGQKDLLETLEEQYNKKAKELLNITQMIQKNPLDVDLLDKAKKLQQEVTALNDDITRMDLQINMRRVPIIDSVVPGGYMREVATWQPGMDVRGYAFTTNNRVTYAIQVSGDSLKEAGINDGSILFVEPTNDAHLGELVIAVSDEGATAKFLIKVGNRYYLHPANNDYDDIPVTENTRIIGVVRECKSINPILPNFKPPRINTINK